MPRRPSVLQVGPFLFDDQLPKLRKNLLSEDILAYRKSRIKNRVFRFFDTVFFMLFHHAKFDVVIIHTFGFLSFYMEDVASFLAKKLHKKVLFHIHGGAFIDFYNEKPQWVKRVFSRANRLSSPSYFLNAGLESLGFKMSYIPNILETDRFISLNLERAPYSILWVRAFHDDYDPMLAIETIKVLKNKFPNVILNMVGPDLGMLSTCKDLINKFNLKDNIRILGRIENTKLLSYYNSNSVFFTTTRYESFGVAILEAARCKIPQVSTNVGEIPFLWEDNKDILLVERDPVKAAISIERLFLSQELSETLSNNAHEKSMKFTWENTKNKWLNLIEN